MAILNPYLNFNGSTEFAFAFYRQVFGTDYTALYRLRDFSSAADMPEAELEKIAFISLPTGHGVSLMGTDLPRSLEAELVCGNNFHISIRTDLQAEALYLYHALSQGGRITAELEETSWGDLFGMFTDRFGIHWMIHYSAKKVVFG